MSKNKSTEEGKAREKSSQSWKLIRVESLKTSIEEEEKNEIDERFFMCDYWKIFCDLIETGSDFFEYF